MIQKPQAALAPFSPEFRLVLACIRLDETKQTAQACAAAPSLDWMRVVSIAKRHRVSGLVARALIRLEIALPSEAADVLQRSAASQTRQAMLLAAESIRLSRLLQQSGIAPLFLKGTTLTVLAYDDLGLRHAKDADVMVPEAQVWQAMQVLRTAGYVPLLDIDAASPERRALWLRHAKSMDWAHSKHGALLELHWRLTDLPMLAGRSDADTRQMVTVAPGADLTTLGPDQLLIYLCTHGAAHGWSRLKWLADIAMLLPWRDEAAMTSLYRTALTTGTGRAVGEALLLCHELLEMPLSAHLLQSLRQDKVLMLLHPWTLRLLSRGNEVDEIYDQRFGTSSIYLSRLLLGTSGSSLLGEMRTWAYPPDQMLVSTLPQPLFFLFPLVRVGAWIAQRLRHGGRSVPQPQ